MDTAGYMLEDIKPPKTKSVKKTAKKQAVKTVDQLSGTMLAWLTFKRLVRFIWTNKVPLIVNAFLVENAYIVAKAAHVIGG